MARVSRLQQQNASVSGSDHSILPRLPLPSASLPLSHAIVADRNFTSRPTCSRRSPVARFEVPLDTLLITFFHRRNGTLVFLLSNLVHSNALWITLSSCCKRNLWKIGRMASDEVILELTETKCLPILLYGLEVYPLSKTNLRSLDFPINRFFMKLFNTSDVQFVTECQSMFNFRLPSVRPNSG